MSDGRTDTDTVDDLRARVAKLRSELRHSAGSEEGAWGVDGFSFAFEVALSRPLPVGGYTLLTSRDGRRYLGQVVDQQIVSRPGPQVSVDLASLLGGDGVVGDAAVTVHLRIAAGDGLLLARLDGDDGFAPVDRHATFDFATLEQAPGELVDAFIEWSRAGVGLDTGAATFGSGEVLPLLSAKGFNRHTFLCGQSGSGKTYGLGVLLERLLLHTTLDVVVLDPNSDYVGLGDLLPERESAARGAAYERVRRHWEQLGDRIVVLGPGEGATPFRIVFSRLTIEQQALILGLDPLTDAADYAAFRALRAAMGETYTLASLLERAESSGDPQLRSLATRIRNVGAPEWDIWVTSDERPVLDAIRSNPRVIVADLGKTESGVERAMQSVAVLEWLWRNRHSRQPRLVVIDEAHNVCPQVPADPLQELAREHVVRIAAEGRKYGLYLLLSTQQPQKIHANALAQCDNLILLRMNSRIDVDHLAQVFGFVPPTLLHQAAAFRLGEGLVAGRISAHAVRYSGDRRWTREGGADVPATWAEPQA